MRVLVTGGAGYIGSHACLSLLEAGYEVAVIDNFANSIPNSLERVAEITGREVLVHEADVRLEHTYKNFLQKWRPEVVIHFAGLKSVSESQVEPLEYYETNVLGTINIVRTSVAAGARSLIFSSSATVYGDQEIVPVTEESETCPVNPYGRSKLAAEEVLRDYHRSNSSIAIGILRYFNPVGAHVSGLIGENPKGTPGNLMPYMAGVASGRYPVLKVFGDDYPTEDGTGVRDYIHVMDLANAHVATLEHLSSSGGLVTWNVGRGHGVSVKQMIEEFAKASGRNIPYRVVGRRAGDIATSFADVDRIGSLTGWRAERGIEEMVADLWRWHYSST